MRQRKAVVLCIDDDGSGLEARRLLLEESGYEVLTATTGKEGLELFARYSVDLVLVDYEMPGMKGDFVAARMKDIKPHVPLVMFSSHVRLPEDKLTSVDAFLSKGESWSSVLAKVDQLRRVPFFARWVDDWKHHRAFATQTSTMEAATSLHLR